jgi:hypothetical protein
MHRADLQKAIDKGKLVLDSENGVYVDPKLTAPYGNKAVNLDRPQFGQSSSVPGRHGGWVPKDIGRAMRHVQINADVKKTRQELQNASYKKEYGQGLITGGKVRHDPRRVKYGREIQEKAEKDAHEAIYKLEKKTEVFIKAEENSCAPDTNGEPPVYDLTDDKVIYPKEEEF